MADFTPQPVKGPSAPQDPEETKQLVTEDMLTSESPKGKFGQFYSDNKWYIWAILVGMLIIGALAAIAFWPRQQERTEAAQVSVTIDSAETAQAGGELIYKIKILNQDPATLVDMNLELVYDDGVSYVSSTPKAENISGSSFSVPDLSTGQNAALIIKTNVQGNINEDKKLVARLRYRFDNFNSPFSLESTHTTKLVAADVVLDISGPEQANNAEEVSYDIFYRNSSDKDIDQARIQFSYPDEFRIISTEPEASLGKNVWNLSTLKANQSGKLSVRGSFSGQSGQTFNLKAELMALDENGDYFTQSSTTFATQISTKPLTVEVSSSSSKDGIVQPGASISGEIKFKNNTQIAHTGLQVVLEVESESVLPGSLQATDGFVQDLTATWNGSSVSALESLNPGNSGSVRFQFKLKNPVSENQSTGLIIKLSPRIKSSQNQQFISGPKTELKISSPSSLGGAVFHHSGSLPPKVGSSSTFKVRLALSNASNDFRDGILVGYVPVGTSLDAGSITGGEKNLVKYDQTTGKLTWNLGRLEAYSGNGKSERFLEFNISFTPSSSQLGQAVTLFKNISFSAVDDFTGQNVSLDSRDLNSSNIQEGSSLGRVISGG